MLPLQHSSSPFTALPLYGPGCCCRQFCLSSRTRPPLLWKCWSPCLSTLSPCKRMWLSGCACCSWSCILAAATTHRLQVSSFYCIAYLLNSKICSSVSATFATQGYLHAVNHCRWYADCQKRTSFREPLRTVRTRPWDTVSCLVNDLNE